MQYQSGNRKDASLGAAVSRGTANVADFERRFGTPTSAANGDRYYTDLRTDIQTALAALESAMDSALTAASATAAATSAAGAAASRADSDSLDAARREDERRSAAVASRKTDQRAEHDKDKAALSDGGSALLGADVGTGLIDGEFSLSIGMPFYTAKTTIGSKDGEGISVTASFYRAWKLRPDGAVRFEIGARGERDYPDRTARALRRHHGHRGPPRRLSVVADQLGAAVRSPLARADRHWRDRRLPPARRHQQIRQRRPPDPDDRHAAHRDR